jgi:hypothetical protein
LVVGKLVGFVDGFSRLVEETKWVLSVDWVIFDGCNLMGEFVVLICIIFMGFDRNRLMRLVYIFFVRD